MTKKEIVQEVSERLGIPVRDSKKVVDTVFKTIVMGLKEKGRVVVDGLGTINVVNRKGPYSIKKEDGSISKGTYEVKTASLKPSKKFKSFINNK